MSGVEIEKRRGGMRIVGSGGGGKGGGGSARTPVEQPDSLHNTTYAALLDVICNGEAGGPVHVSQPLRDVYLDGTPIQNDDGTLNFRDVQVEVRHGTQDQDHIPGFPASANVVSVGVEIKDATPWVQTITNPDLSAVRVSLHWPQLMEMVDSGKKAGDRIGVKIEYAIDLAVGGDSFTEVVRTNVDGKTVNGYTRTHRIELPTSASGWTVRVRRITPESTVSSVQDAMTVQSYAEVIDGKFRHPMTAMVGIKIDAEQFRAIPTRAYRWRGQIIRVPDNYDPIARTYSGVWSGTFKRAWSNNPAWVYYDILTNKLYGLGSRVDASMIDRYSLYQIGAYCDQLVDDGQGGQEPRFVCNTYIQAKADALRVLNDLTSVFRGMAYWANGQVVAVSDSPSDPMYTYTNANVVDGRFEYTGADLSTRKTVALVSWNDPSDFYRAKVEAVNDDEGILRYGIRKTEMKAFGCVSRGQAQRAGLYHLCTSRMDTGGISFAVGLDGVIPQPGGIIKIADRNRAGRHLGGRIVSATTTTITLDRDHPAKVGNTLTVNLPSGVAQTRPVTAVAARVVTVSPAFSAKPESQSIWAIDADDLVTQHARVISVKERDGIIFDVAAVAHHPGKFDVIDNGARLDPLPISVVPPRVQTAPTNILITEHQTVDQGIARTFAEISWDKSENAVAYDVQWRRDSGEWVTVPRTGTRLIQISDAHSGLYLARVRAINSLDVPSIWAYSISTTISGKTTPPPVPTFLTTEALQRGNRINWGFPALGAADVQRTEIWVGENANGTGRVKASDATYPQSSFDHIGLDSFTDLYYWARFVDRSLNTGAFYPAGSGVLGRPLNLQLDADSIASEMIQDGALTITKFADSIKPPVVMETLPVVGSEGDNVYLVGDGKLYTWKNGKWDATVKADQIPEVNVDALQGMIDIEHIPQIPTSRLAGTIQTSQIAAGAIDSTRVANGLDLVKTVTSLPTVRQDSDTLSYNGQLYAWDGSKYVSKVRAIDVDGKLTADQIEKINAAQVAGQLTNDQIADVNAAKVVGQLVDSQLAGISTNKLVGTVKNSQIDAVAATKISGQITNEQIASLEAAKLAGKITETQIDDGSISAPKLAAGAVVAEKIAAGAITASKLTVVDRSNLIPDPLFEDAACWSNMPTRSGWGSLSQYKNMLDLRGPGNGTIPVAALSSHIPIEPGETYYCSTGVYMTATAADAGCYIELYCFWYDTEGVSITSAVLGKSKTSYRGPIGREVTVPTDAYSMRVGIRSRTVTSGMATVGDLYAFTPVLRKSASAELIVDGAITASKIAVDAITTDKLAANAVTTAKINAGAVTANEIATNAVTAVKISANAVTTQKIAAGAVTADELAANSVVAGKVAANAITADKISANAVTTAKIAAGAITANELAANSVIAAKVAANAITTTKIAANAVTANELAANSVTASQIAADAVTTAAIQAGAVKADQISAGAITASKLTVADLSNLVPDPAFEDSATWIPAPSLREGFGAIDRYKNMMDLGGAGVAGSTIPVTHRTRDIPVEPGRDYYFGAGFYVYGSGAAAGDYGEVCLYQYSKAAAYLTYHYVRQNQSGDRFVGRVVTMHHDVNFVRLVVRSRVEVEGSGTAASIFAFNPVVRRAADAELIVDGAVTADKISANAVTAVKINAGAITADKIATNAVTTQKIAANAITADKISANAVTTAKIAAGAVTANEIATNAVTAAKVAANAITTNKIAAGAVTANELAANAITAGKIAAGAVGADQISAGAITTSKLTLTGSNLIPNGDLGTGDFTDWLIYTASPQQRIQTFDGGSTNVCLNSIPAKHAVQFTGSADYSNISTFSHGSSYTGWDGDGFEVKEGETYYVSIDVIRSGTSFNNFHVRPYYRTRSGTNKAGAYALQAVPTDITTTGYVTLEGKFTVPSDAVKGRMLVRADSFTSGYLYWTNLRVIRMMSSELVVDGSIKTQHLTANSIQGDRILANSISGDKLVVSSLASRIASINTAYVDSANIYDGAITNAKIGTAAITTAKIGTAQVDRLRISGNAVTVFDSGSVESAEFADVSAWTEVASVPISFPESSRGMLFLRVQGMKVSGSNNPGLRVRVKINSTVVATMEDYTYLAGSGVWRDILGAGAHYPSSTELDELGGVTGEIPTGRHYHNVPRDNAGPHVVNIPAAATLRLEVELYKHHLPTKKLRLYYDIFTAFR